MKRLFLGLFFLSMIFGQKVFAESQWVKLENSPERIEVIESTPWGLLSTTCNRLNPPTVDAIFISKDLGESWEDLGLQDICIADLKYFDGKIYALTGGFQRDLLVSSNKGKTWTTIAHQLPNAVVVERDAKTIYVGSLEYGVLVSTDEGQTWVRKTTDGTYYHSVFDIVSSKNVTIANGNFSYGTNLAFITKDNGDSWEEIPGSRNSWKVLTCVDGDVIFWIEKQSKVNISTDGGETWERVADLGNYVAERVFCSNGKYYVATYNMENGTHTVVYTQDLGKTWVDTNLDISGYNKILGLIEIFLDKGYLFAVTESGELFRYQIPNDQPPKFSFLDIPWLYENESELVDKITSYFDHSYPLLGYSYFSEPENERETTLNFLGIKNTEPHMYYTSHSGTDFKLKYGTNILAPASGFATYSYCEDCGNTIKIDHLNGYQTVYMHLQDEDLVTESNKFWVNKYDKIGKVGLTGRTTGPHLHFEVTKDKDSDGTFENDFPMGRVDPFGWQNLKKDDPWKIFNWQDSLGSHTGSESLYLWNTNTPSSAAVIEDEENPDGNKVVNLENKHIEFESPQNSFTAKIISYIYPSLRVLRYIQNTSFILEVFDQVGNKITDFEKPIKINIDIDLSKMVNINPESIKLYFWNEVSKVWELIPSFFDLENNKVTAQTHHLSWFAVFGESLLTNIPETKILVSGSQNNGWFYEPPLIEFSFDESESTLIDNTFYSTSDGEVWEVYSEPFFVQEDGIVDLIYKSQDIEGNMEEEKNLILHINLQGKRTEKIRVTNANFEVTH